MKCVYKIVCKDKSITEFYIGSSVNFNRRIRIHKSNSNNLNCNAYCFPLYMFINVNGGFDNWEFEVIKEFKFITRKELTINEQYYKNKLKPELNAINAFGWDIENNKKTRNRKINCPICNETMNQGSLSRHKKRKHSLDIEKNI